MALPPQKITDRLAVRLAGLVDSSNADLRAILEVYVGIKPEQDEWEIIKFVVREDDELTFNREKYVVEKITYNVNEATINHTLPDASVGLNVVLASATNRISLSA
jgi:hypothetical protein